MAISPKPKRSPASEAAVAEFIDRGLRRDEPAPAPERKSFGILLELEVDLVERVNRAVRARPGRLPRKFWLIEAILEKLEREGH